MSPTSDDAIPLDALPPEGAGEPSPEETEVSPRARAEAKIDRYLTFAVLGLLVIVLGAGSWFGYSMYRMRQESRMSTPAMRALELMRKAVRNKPNDAPIRVRYGEMLASAGMPEEAVNQFKYALKLDPKHTGAYLDLGMVGLQMEKLDDAKAAFEKVLDLSQGSDYQNLNARVEQAHFYLGQILIKKKKYEEAVGQLKAALRIRRDASDTYYYLGVAYRELGDDDAAIENLKYAIAFDSNYADALYELGLVQAGKGEKADAAIVFRKALDIQPEAEPPMKALAAMGTAEEWSKKARAALDGGDIPAAIDAAVISRSIDPEHLPALLVQAAALERSRQTANALAVYQTAAKLAPDDATVKAALQRLSKPAKK